MILFGKYLYKYFNRSTLYVDGYLLLLLFLNFTALTAHTLAYTNKVYHTL